MQTVISADEIKLAKSRFKIEHEELFYEGKKPKTLRDAFVISLAKWSILKRESGEGNYIDDGQCDTCGLCMKYMGSDYLCIGCPIYKHTEQHQCHGTEYYVYRDNYDDVPEALTAAKSMYNLLEKLATKHLSK